VFALIVGLFALAMLATALSMFARLAAGARSLDVGQLGPVGGVRTGDAAMARSGPAVDAPILAEAPRLEAEPSQTRADASSTESSPREARDE
jgi:hypothetical protein